MSKYKSNTGLNSEWNNKLNNRNGLIWKIKNIAIASALALTMASCNYEDIKYNTMNRSISFPVKFVWKTENVYNIKIQEKKDKNWTIYYKSVVTSWLNTKKYKSETIHGAFESVKEYVRGWSNVWSNIDNNQDLRNTAKHKFEVAEDMYETGLTYNMCVWE